MSKFVCVICGYSTDSKGVFSGHRKKFHSIIPVGKMCDHGCGDSANFLVGNTWCCSARYYDCPASKVTYPRKCDHDHCDYVASNKTNYCYHKKHKHGEQKIIPPGTICEHQCGQLAQYVSFGGKYRCSENAAQCPNISANISKTNKSLILQNQRSFLINRHVDVSNLCDATIERMYSEMMKIIMKSLPDTKKEQIQNAREATYLRKLGVINPAFSKQCSEKKQRTWSEKTDQQIQDMLVKQSLSGKKYKTFTFPSGLQIKIQGYEGIVIEELLKSGLGENEIVTQHSTLMPKFAYEILGSTRKYIPDLYLPRFNMIIEVKSMWTFIKHKEINLLKRKACIDRGFHFRFIIR